MMPDPPPVSGDVRGPEGFESWLEAAWHDAVPVRLRALEPVEKAFSARWRSSSWGRVGIHRQDSDYGPPFAGQRSPALIRRGDLDLYALVLQLEGGALISQSEREQNLGQGEMVLLDTSRPFTDAASPGSVSRLLLLFPHDALGLNHDQVAARLAGRALPLAHGVGPLLASLLGGIKDHVGELSAATAEYAAGHALDLLSVFLSELLDSPAGDRAVQRSLVLQAKAHIRRNLADPDLTPQTVASAHHVSLRHLQKLFAEQGLTVSGFIRRERLERCRRQLDQASRTGTSVTDIAFRAGFRDSAHFSRAFKAAYGISPRDYRALAGNAEALPQP